MQVVIPTAGLGSRLDLSTEHLNKSMLQLGDLPVISKIIDSYPPKANFIVLTGYKGSHISEFLKLVYKKKKIKIVKVDKFKGTGSSLTYTLKKSLKYITEPFFFHANDTIFLDKNFHLNIKKDTLFLHTGKSDTMKYATVEIKKDFKKIHDKLNYLRKDFFNYTGVAYIADINRFKKKIREDKINNGELSYFKSIDPNKINYKFINNWFDIGSKEQKQKAENFFRTRNILPKFDQGIFFKNKKVYKFFTNPDIVKKRYLRSKILNSFVPIITTKKKYFYVYDYIPGKVFSKLNNKRKNFIYLLDWLKSKFWKKKKLNEIKKLDFKKKCNNFYYEKSLSRINFLYEKNNIKDSRDIINKKKVNKISELFDKIDWQKLNDGLPVNFHGDLHFENIVMNKKKITLLDWREDFSELNEYGDLYYDLAKINHGLIISHDVIESSKYKILISKKNISLNFYQSSENKKCQKVLFKFLKQNNLSLKKLNILTSLIFLNIAALHHYPYSIFLFYLGKLTLNNAINSKN